MAWKISSSYERFVYTICKIEQIKSGKKPQNLMQGLLHFDQTYSWKWKQRCLLCTTRDKMPGLDIFVLHLYSGDKYLSGLQKRVLESFMLCDTSPWNTPSSKRLRGYCLSWLLTKHRAACCSLPKQKVWWGEGWGSYLFYPAVVLVQASNSHVSSCLSMKISRLVLKMVPAQFAADSLGSSCKVLAVSMLLV